MIFVNFKTYRAGTGERAVELARVCQKVARETSAEIIPLVQAVDIFRLSQAGFTVWAQHADAIEYGAHTGQVLPEGLVAAGAVGVMLNHSEKRLAPETIKETIRRFKIAKLQNCKVLVCVEGVEEAKEIEKFHPDFIAYEPPELIGSKTTSVATAKAEVVKDFVEQISLPVLAGAGIRSAKDVKIALKLGARGVLVSSEVVLAEDPEERLRELAEPFKMTR